MALFTPPQHKLQNKQGTCSCLKNTNVGAVRSPLLKYFRNKSAPFRATQQEHLQLPPLSDVRCLPSCWSCVCRVIHAGSQILIIWSCYCSLGVSDPCKIHCLFNNVESVQDTRPLISCSDKEVMLITLARRWWMRRNVRAKELEIQKTSSEVICSEMRGLKLMS